MDIAKKAALGKGGLRIWETPYIKSLTLYKGFVLLYIQKNTRFYSCSFIIQTPDLLISYMY